MTVRNILTLDIEDWYQSSLAILDSKEAMARPSEQVIVNTRRMLDLLEAHGASATCFVLGSVAETFPELVREIRSRGHDVASHGYSHRLVYQMTPQEFRADVLRSIELIDCALEEQPRGGSARPSAVRGYRAPYFSITPATVWALDVLAELGLEYDSSLFPIRRRLYGFPGGRTSPHQLETSRGPLREFPPGTIRLLGQNLPIGGGGYLRLFPFELIRQSLRRLNVQGKPVVFYLHPYELNAGAMGSAPVAQSWKNRWVEATQNLGRSKIESKVERLLAEFQWTSIERWLHEQGQNQAKS